MSEQNGINSEMNTLRNTVVVTLSEDNVESVSWKTGFDLSFLRAGLTVSEDTGRDVIIAYEPCAYEMRSTSEVGDIMVCTTHNSNSKWGQTYGTDRPCLEIDPWDGDVYLREKDDEALW